MWHSQNAARDFEVVIQMCGYLRVFPQPDASNTSSFNGSFLHGDSAISAMGESATSDAFE